MLARACWKCGEAVALAGLVRTGDTDEEPFKLLAFFASSELLAWAKANRCPWNSETCALAAKHERVEALQWAREHDCPCDEFRVHSPLGMGTWRRWCGRGSTAARGMRSRVKALLWAGTWRCCNGRWSTTVRAPNLMYCLDLPPRAGTVSCCRGFVSRVAS